MSWVSRSFRISLILSQIPADSIRYRYAWAVTAYPSGMLTPFFCRFCLISPSEAFFPPTSGMSFS